MATAELSFVPWVRQGLAAAISQADTGNAKIPAVVAMEAAIAVNGAAGPAIAVRLRGPADVVGIDVNQIIRMDPRPGSIDFEPNYFPCIEFDRPDFPWLFTPARADDKGRLRPWLCLAVARAERVTIGTATDSPLPALSIEAKAKEELPPLDECWAWAHAQVAGASAAAADVGKALSGSPDLSLSRLLCPRVLQPSTDYVACLVPTFEVGRKAGLGLPIEQAELEALHPAWLPDQTGVVLPVFHHWQFRTGPGGDFQKLALLLRAREAPAGFGKRPVAIGKPGFVLADEVAEDTTLPFEGALKPLTGGDDPEPDPWPDGVQTKFQDALVPIINAPATRALVKRDAGPLLAPPLYGQWHAALPTVTPEKPDWYDQLNVDPRWRSVAALGVQVVQQNQEALMAAAWEQAAKLAPANQKMRQLQLSLAVGTSLFKRHFLPLKPEAMVRVSAPAFARMRTAPGSDAETVLARIESSALPQRATGGAMRRMTRERGPLARRFAALGIERSDTHLLGALRGGIAANLVGAFSAGITANLVGTFSTDVTVSGTPPPASIATSDTVLSQLAAGTAVRRYSDVTEATVTEMSRRPEFAIFPEGSPLVPTPVGAEPATADNAQAAAFRAAAREHLARVKRGRTSIMVGPPPPPPPPLDLREMRKLLVAQMEPRVALIAMARAVVTIGENASAPVDTPAAEAVGIDTIMVHPKFETPMYAALRDLSQDLLLPGLDEVKPETVLGLETNRRFIESYLVGLNYEMARELLWRGFPTDQRGTYFDRFWDGTGAAEERPDIRPVDLWKEAPLGENAPGDTNNHFVMLLRSTLLRRYPNAIIYAVRAVGEGSRRPSKDSADEKWPVFHGAMQPDIAFFGFNLTAAQVAGTHGKKGYYLIIQEHPTEPRFGVDAKKPPIGTSHLAIGTGPPAGHGISKVSWGRNSAHMAGAMRRRPVRIAIHASQFVASDWKEAHS